MGHLSSINSFDSIGKMGLEKILHETLQGQQGKLMKTINSIGRSIHTTEIKTAFYRAKYYTTLDLSITTYR